MTFLFPTRKKTIGIECKDYVIRYVEGRSSSSAHVSSYGEAYIPPGIVKNGVIVDTNSFELLLRSCVSKWGLKKKSIHFIVPDTFVVIRKQQIPADITEEEIRGYIHLELGHSIHLPFESPTFDFIPLGQKEDKQEILLFASPDIVVQSYASMFEKAKLNPLSADLSSLSLMRVYEEDKKISVDELMLLKLDVSDANITIFHETTPVFMQNQKFAYEDAIEFSPTGMTVRDKQLVMTEIDELMEEIDRILHFYKYSFMGGAGNMQKLLLAGDHPLLEEVYGLMRNRLSFPAELLSASSAAVANDEAFRLKYYPALGLIGKGV
ncbi:type IV pilus biogenesis protein PilM [Ectobacillus polymachus]|uniref:type IV pilus biogenesis protein PilM n=1 Tax=Ectobacillus polymachus TaxID=1508806 RepID=UPI003A874F6A